MATAVIVAGGDGRRLGGAVPKFEVPLLGRPMVLYSLDACQKAESIDSIILVLPPARLSGWSLEEVRGHGISKASATVAGGDTRQESVFNALCAAGPGPGTIVIHDAARPLVTPDLLDAACDIPKGFAGRIAAVPATDTLKRVEGRMVGQTLDRGEIVYVQTPQAFDLDVLLMAHKQARADGFTGTDDSTLVERIGQMVATVEGSRENIKVTYPSDILCAEAILLGRKR